MKETDDHTEVGGPTSTSPPQRNWSNLFDKKAITYHEPLLTFQLVRVRVNGIDIETFDTR